MAAVSWWVRRQGTRWCVWKPRAQRRAAGHEPCRTRRLQALSSTSTAPRGRMRHRVQTVGKPPCTTPRLRAATLRRPRQVVPPLPRPPPLPHPCRRALTHSPLGLMARKLMVGGTSLPSRSRRMSVSLSANFICGRARRAGGQGRAREQVGAHGRCVAYLGPVHTAQGCTEVPKEATIVSGGMALAGL